MANEVLNTGGVDLSGGIPLTPFAGVLAAMSTGYMTGLSLQGSFLALAVDIGIVAGVTSGYIQFADQRNGNTIWVTQPDSTIASYASWRGFYVYEYGVSGDPGLSIFNNTTSAVGVHISGLWLPYQSYGANIAAPPMAPV